MKRNTGCLIGTIVGILAAAGIAAIVLGIPTAVRLWMLINQTLAQDTLSAVISVHNTASDGYGDITAEFTWVPWMEERFYGLTVGNQTLCYHNQTVYFDTGRGYEIQPVLAELPLPQREDLWLLLFAGVRQERTENGRTYTLVLTEEQLHSAGLQVPAMTIVFTEADHSLQRFSLSLENGWEFSAVVTDNCTTTIPTEILMASGSVSESIETVLPLIHGCIQLAQKEEFYADALVRMDFGPMPLEDQIRIIGTEQGLYLYRDHADAPIPLWEDSSHQALVLGLAWTMCRSGSVATEGTDRFIYSLELEPEELGKLFQLLLPQLAEPDIPFSAGAFTVTVSGGEVREAALNCSAEIPFWITTLPAVFSLDLSIAAETPQSLQEPFS